MKKRMLKRCLGIIGATLLVCVQATGNVSQALQFFAAAGARQRVETKTRERQDSGEVPVKYTEEPAVPFLEAASMPGDSIKLHWRKIEGAEAYVLLRSRKKEDGFQKIYQTKAGKYHYTDRNRVRGKVYYYQLEVLFGDSSEIRYSDTVKGRSLRQVKLTGISNVSGSRKLVLHWKPVKGAAAYQVMRRGAGQRKYHVIASVDGKKTSYTDKKRTGGNVYYYKVRARDEAGGCGRESHAMSQMAIDRHKKMIALTYDDGPSRYTPEVLKALKKYNAHATFFVVGSNVGRYPAAIRRGVALGCEIGNHTYGHNNLKKLSAGQIKSVLKKTNRAVKRQTGKNIRIMRPPGGNHNASVRQAVDMPLILWSIDTLDWKTRSTSATMQCVLHNACDGAVVLMHDLHKPAAEGAETIIRKLKARGYQLVTVSEMAAYRGGMTAGKAYSHFRQP